MQTFSSFPSIGQMLTYGTSGKSILMSSESKAFVMSTVLVTFAIPWSEKIMILTSLSRPDDVRLCLNLANLSSISFST